MFTKLPGNFNAISLSTHAWATLSNNVLDVTPNYSVIRILKMFPLNHYFFSLHIFYLQQHLGTQF